MQTQNGYVDRDLPVLNASKASGNMFHFLFATIFVTLKHEKKESVVYRNTQTVLVTRPRPYIHLSFESHFHVIDELGHIVYENLVKIFKQLVEIFSHERKSP